MIKYRLFTFIVDKNKEHKIYIKLNKIKTIELNFNSTIYEEDIILYYNKINNF